MTARVNNPAAQRAVALKQRCRHAWLAEVWEAMARAELRRDPSLLRP